MSVVKSTPMCILASLDGTANSMACVQVVYLNNFKACDVCHKVTNVTTDCEQLELVWNTDIRILGSNNDFSDTRICVYGSGQHSTGDIGDTLESDKLEKTVRARKKKMETNKNTTKIIKNVVKTAYGVETGASNVMEPGAKRGRG